MNRYKLMAPCHFGLEAVLKKEIIDLGYDILQVEDGRVTFEGDAEGSLIRDFNFMNYNKNAIILKDISDVTISNNNITAIFNERTNQNSAILVSGVGDDNIISNNNIYVNSKIDYAYGISIPSYNFLWNLFANIVHLHMNK